MNTKEQIKENIEKILSVSEGKATLLAATKTVPAGLINYAAGCGITLIGENRVNELLQKYDEIDKSRLKIHFIGALQTNKVKYIIDKVSMIQSLDRLSLAEEIEKQAAKHKLVMPVLVEINIGREETKSGVFPEDAMSFCKKILEFPHISLRGLMAVPPKCENSDENRKYFLKMKEIFVDISDKIVDNSNNMRDFGILSMGMSGDYETAVDCGSNMIRVGSAIFGKRDYGNKK